MLICFTISWSAANERAALVIGNQQYATAPLETPEADAKAMADHLRRAGYMVTRLVNLRQSEFYDAVDAFFSQRKNAKVILFFYAGHALQVNGKNFMVPVDINPKDPDILSRMFDLRYLLNKMTESRSETKLVILDACRNNIFSANPNVGSGLSELISPPGSFVAFSTSPGSTAEDGDGDNSPYTTALLGSLFRPKVKIEDAFKEVRRKVRLLTNDRQTPWENTSLIQDFYFVSENIAPGLSLGTRSHDSMPTRINSASRSLLAAGDQINEKYCSRILTKLSMGIGALSDEESEALTKCRH